jgi:hypothetical protein
LTHSGAITEEDLRKAVDEALTASSS